MRFRAVATLAVVGLLAACASPGATPTATSAPTEAPTAIPSPTATPVPEAVSLVLDFSVDESLVPLLYGIQQGFFAQQGIDLKILPSTGSNVAMTEIDAKKVDFAFTGMSTLITDKATNHTDTIGVMNWQNYPTIAIASLTPLANPQDMVGKSFGTIAYSSGRQTLPLVLKANGVDPTKVPIKILDFSVLYQALFAGQVDTAETAVPWSFDTSLTAQGAKLGKTVYFKSLADWGLIDYNKVLITRTDVIQSKPDLVTRMVRAMNMSLQQAETTLTDDQVVALLTAQDPQTDAAGSIEAWHGVKALFNNPGPFDPAEVATIFARTIDENKVTTTLQPTDFYTNQFILGN
jgi:NitT/TauT family transport system substrate-binding protein